MPVSWNATEPELAWDVINSNNAGGTSPELRFSWKVWVNQLFRISTDFIDASQANDLKLSFQHKVEYDTMFGSDEVLLKVLTKTEGHNWVERWSITPVWHVPPTKVEIDLSDLDGEKFKIAWVCQGDPSDINYWYIDDIVVEQNQ